MKDNAGYGLLGAHGGTQEFVKKIPIIISGPTIQPGVDKKPMRLMDLRAHIVDAMKL